jgi:hypothetical protein
MKSRIEKRNRLYSELALESFCASSALEGIKYTDDLAKDSVSGRKRRQLYSALTSNTDESVRGQ